MRWNTEEFVQKMSRREEVRAIGVRAQKRKDETSY